MAQFLAVAGQPHARHGRRAGFAQDVESEREAGVRAHRGGRLKVDDRDPPRRRRRRRRGVQPHALLDQRGQFGCRAAIGLVAVGQQHDTFFVLRRQQAERGGESAGDIGAAGIGAGARRIDAHQARIAQRRQQARAAAKLEHRQPVARTHRRAQRLHLLAHPLELVGRDRMRGVHRDHHGHPLRRGLERQAQAGEQGHQDHEQARAQRRRARARRTAPRAHGHQARRHGQRHGEQQPQQFGPLKHRAPSSASPCASAAPTPRSIATSARATSHVAIGFTWVAARTAIADAVSGAPFAEDAACRRRGRKIRFAGVVVVGVDHSPWRPPN